AKQGFFVFICDTQKKQYAPIAPNGYLSATNDVQTINSWRMPDEVTVAIACKQSQLIVFDCDVKNGIDGVTAFHEFAQQSAI
ncbi:bifunctional DNA primase/polymerase, partial [Staphylococcus aureus]